MSSDYPNSIDTFTNPLGTDSLSSPDHALLHTHVNSAVTNLQLELGTSAKGTDTSVRARLDRLDSTVMLATRNLSELNNTATARSNLGLGTIATQNSNNVSITGGTITGTTVTGIAVAGLTNPVAVVDGGTGATTAAGARTSFGLGTIATQAANSVAITGGTIAGASINGGTISSLSTALAVADGGTGATTVAGARTALGLGTIALQAASNVAISGGTITGTVLTGAVLTGGNIGSLNAPIAIADGGTGSATASGARITLGLGSIATQASSNVTITGGAISGVSLTSLTSALAIASGGTGSTTAAGARTSLGLGTVATQDSSAISITGGSTINLSKLTAGTNDGLGTTNAKTVRFADSGTTTDGSVAIVGRVEAGRTFATTSGGEAYALNVYSAPVFNVGVANTFGIFVEGAPSGSAAPNFSAGMRLHWDSPAGVTTPLHVGVSSHIGVVGGVITEARGIEIETAQLFGTITKSVGIRINGQAGSTNWSLLEPVGGAVDTATTPKMHHMGPIHVGGSTAETAPSARLQVTETTPGNEVVRFTTEATNDDPMERLFQVRDITTTSTAKNIFTFAISSSKTWLMEAVVVARCTGGGPGSESGATYIRRAAFQNIFGSAVILGAVTDGHTAESVSSWDCTITTDYDLGGSGPNVYVRIKGAASTSITWHGHIRIWEVGS